MLFKNKTEELFFALLSSCLMAYGMNVYNIAIHTGGLHLTAFVDALYSFPLSWFIAFLLITLIVSKTAVHLTFKIVQPDGRPAFKTLGIQTFTVCMMVPLMALYGTLISSGLTANLPTLWLQAILLNFLMAYPLQVFIVGPFARKVFGMVFGNAHTSDKMAEPEIV
ncbi:hypothetical protein MsAg5_11910 [Methanosarcinaceae archaeon Ag5]|uniref:DUF2798 domain-containing protein n=1 Tax=Methanolapillus africanus TaxID=3028297 RepID=A0AAE4SDB5_9EURY|nr:hypothetical protein [Methanosarcinaceae archaeon Ag5]